jgi:5-methyltetrahydropteroyltriglutamate--homocysteine methyltransferase
MPIQPENRHPLAAATLPLLPTLSIGSHAPMGWLIAGLDSATRGEMGRADVAEMFRDALEIAVLDQQRAGLDLLVDGEMSRLDFNLGFYARIAGLEPLSAERRLGPDAHDQRGKWRVTESLSAPNGLGCLADFTQLLEIADRPVKASVPGPFTLAGRLALDGIYGDRMEAAWALSPIVNAELRQLVIAGADFIYLDEPSFAVYPDGAAGYVELFNATVTGVEAKIGTHLCFGNYRGRAVARRSYRPLFPWVLDLRAGQLSLEFANREMAEVGLWAELAGASGKELAAGVVDVKNSWCEPPEEVAGRIRLLLKHVPAEKLWLTPDCGLSQTARPIAVRKLHALVEGAKIVRRELTGDG